LAASGSGGAGDRKELAMRVTAAYVVLSHRNAQSVERLVHRILELSPDAAALVRHDARQTPAPVIASNRVLVESHTETSDWGSWELVDTSLRALSRAATEFDPELLVLISGQDYPCRNLTAWEREVLGSGSGSAWVCADVHQLDYHPHWGRRGGEGKDALTRYAYRWYPLPGGRWLQHSGSGAASTIRNVLNRIGRYLEPAINVRTVTRGRGYHVGLRPWRSPFGPQSPCFKGSQWIAMDRANLDRIVSELGNNRRLRRAYERSIIPDESVFQTILARTGPPLAGASVSFNVWEAENDAPRILTSSDVDDIQASGAAFCRKLEPGVSDDLATELDRITAHG
jgi:hypothetical protein